MTNPLLIERDAHVLEITLNRPEKRNALTLPMYETLKRTLDEAAGDRAVRAVMISGAGGSFCGGNEVGAFIDPKFNVDATPIIAFLTTLATFPKPWVAAVTGHAVGIGTTLLLHCDLVYASESARFQLPFVNLGLCPEAGSSLLLARRVGEARAREWLLLGEPIGVQDALAAGLINAIVPEATLLDHARANARKLAAKPAGAIAASKALMRGDNAALLKAIEAEAREFARLARTPEVREAVTAFLEKRAPDFSRFE